MMQLKICFIALLGIYGSSKAQNDGPRPEEELLEAPIGSEVNDLFDEFWNWLIENNPETSTLIGLTSQNAELMDLSLESILSQYNVTQKFYERATELRAKSVDQLEKDNLADMLHMLKIFNDGKSYQGYLKPLSDRNGVHVSLRKLLPRMPNQTNTDILTMVERLKKFPVLIQQTITLMQKGFEEGIVYHNVSMNKVTGSIEKFIVSQPEESPLYDYFQDDWLPQDSNATGIQEMAREAITEISDSLMNLRSYIETNYTTRANIGITTIPGGKEFYDACIRYYIPGVTFQEIHNIGLKEVDRIVALMTEIIAELGHEGMPIKEFSNMIKSDENNYYNSSEELVAGCQSLIDDRIQPKLINYFNNFPKASVRVIGDPSPTVTAYYQIASHDGKVPGSFIIGTSHPRLWPKYVLPSLTLHEANPGHHFQITLKNELEGIPMFRKYSGSFDQIALVPSTFPSYSAFIEGWGLYSEYLGIEMGIYETPLEKFGHYSQELLRACRLVVDTGMHALGWDREKAITFLEERLPYDRKFFEIQTDRYITWPGQALTYKLGQLEILRWRKDAEQTLGDRMDIKEFHSVILNNPTDLNTLKGKIQSWIQEKKLGNVQEPVSLVESL